MVAVELNTNIERIFLCLFNKQIVIHSTYIKWYLSRGNGEAGLRKKKGGGRQSLNKKREASNWMILKININTHLVISKLIRGRTILKLCYHIILVIAMMYDTKSILAKTSIIMLIVWYGEKMYAIYCYFSYHQRFLYQQREHSL